MQLNIKNSNVTRTIANYAFYLALTIELILVILDKSFYIIQYDGQWFRLTFALFLAKMIFTEYSKREWIIIGAFILLGTISYLVTGRNEILRLIVMIAACKNVKHDFVFKYIFFFTLAGCIVLIIFSFCGIGAFSLTRDFGRGAIATRYCMGLGHPNGLHCMYWALSSLYLYIYGEKNKWIKFAIIFAGNIGLFILTDSRTGVVVTTLTLAIYIIMSLNLSQKAVKAICRLAYVGVAVSFIVSILMMSHKFFWSKLGAIDELLTGRILGTHMAIMQAKTYFWLPFSTSGRELQTDLGIVKAIYWYGYAPTIIFLIICCLLIHTSIDAKDRLAIMIVISIIVYSIFEGHDVSEFLARNYIFFLIGKYWTEMIGEKCTESKEAVG